jgi:hypothetical protein
MNSHNQIAELKEEAIPFVIYSNESKSMSFSYTFSIFSTKMLICSGI